MTDDFSGSPAAGFSTWSAMRHRLDGGTSSSNTPETGYAREMLARLVGALKELAQLSINAAALPQPDRCQLFGGAGHERRRRLSRSA
jgi:hypothetical protein